MNLLIVTQVVDKDDLVLGFFHRWIEVLALKHERITVICLSEGRHSLPANVCVHSLGKERGRRSSLTYAAVFLRMVWMFRNDYNVVFVHQNQEYLLIAGILWKLLGKRTYLWRNHYAGSWLTDVAVLFATNVFCTSKFSYTAKFAKTVYMPVGVDLEEFDTTGSERKPNSILFLARIASSKRPEMLIEALSVVRTHQIPFTASFVGSPAPGNEPYLERLYALVQSRGLGDHIQFLPGIPHSDTPAAFRSHDVFVNCSPSGMFDKTLFEAAACGCRVIAASEDFRRLAGEDAYAPNAQALAKRLIAALSLKDDIASKRQQMNLLAREQSLATLADRLVREWGNHL